MMNCIDRVSKMLRIRRESDYLVTCSEQIVPVLCVQTYIMYLCQYSVNIELTFVLYDILRNWYVVADVAFLCIFVQKAYI